MPNRIIKESICYSDDVDRLSSFAETVFYRLLVNVDDYGRIDGRPSFLKSRLFATKQGVTEKAVSEAIAQMACIGIVKTYLVSEREYLYFPKWHLHQRIRESKAKYPEPPQDDIDISTAEKPAAATCGELPPESNPDINPNPESESGIMPGAGKPPEQKYPIISLPLNDKSEYPIFEEQCREWADLYPAVDMIQQLRSMRAWLLSNPDKRKTKRGIKRFINGWLGREQDKGWKPLVLSQSQKPPAGNRFFELARKLDKKEQEVAD